MFGRAIPLVPMTGQFARSLQQVPPDEWPQETVARMTHPPREVWRNRDYLLVVYDDAGYERLSVVRVAFDAQSGRFSDGIRWDDLQELKRQCGRGDRWAVECYPANDDVVNVQNMRHLFILPEAPPYAWRKDERPAPSTV